MADFQSDSSQLVAEPNPAVLGFQYEQLLTTHLTIKCALRQDIADFRLVCNAKGVEKLDDIIIEIDFTNQEKQVILCQLKHRKKKNKRTLFKYDEYEKVYEDILKRYNGFKITVVLFTNWMKTCPNYVDAIKRTFEEENVLSIFNTNGCKGQCYQLKSTKSRLYENSFLFCDQVHAEEGDQLISSDLKNSVSVQEIDVINAYFKKCMTIQTESHTKSGIIFMLRNFLVQPYIIEQVNNITSFPDQLLQTFIQFNLSRISKRNYPYLLKSVTNFLEEKFNRLLGNLEWEDKLNEQILKKLKKFQMMEQFVNSKRIYEPLIKKDLWLLFWTIGQLPLILKCGKRNEKQINFLLKHLSTNLSIVLIDEENLIFGDCLDQMKIFHNLSYLENKCLLHKILDESNIQLQFNKITLNEAICTDFNLLKQISPDAFIQFVCEEIQISSVYERTSFYIKRQLMAKLYRKEVVNCGSIISIVDDDPSLPHIDSFHDTGTNIYSELTPMVTVTKAQEKLVDQLYCCFQTIGDKYFCYFNNIGKHNVIQEFLEDDVVTEGEFSKCEHQCKIIYGPAGIGKTIFLENLATSSTDYLYVYCNINDVLLTNEKELLFADVDTLLDYLSTTMNISKDGHIKPFIKSLLFKYYNKNHLYLLCDSLDESNPKSEMFLKITNILKIPIIIATRFGKTDELLELLDASTFELKEFVREDQELFIIKNNPNVDPALIINTIVSKLSDTPTLNFLGIPLLISLLLQIYDDKKDELEQWDLTSLFDKFLTKRLEVYASRNERRTIKKLACSIFFEDSILNELNINVNELKEDLEDLTKVHKKDTIISSVNVANQIRFTHRTYAEFLCAQNLLKIFIDAPNKRNYSKIVELLYAEELLQVRFFFDLLSTKDNPLFNAILLNNNKYVLDHLKEKPVNLLKTDELGRTSLHVIMGYGIRYNYPYLVTGLKTVLKLKTYIPAKETNQFAIDIEILIEILKTSEENILEDSFGNYPYTYGFFSRSFKFLDAYCHYFDLHNVPEINKCIFFIFLVVYHNFEILFEKYVDLQLIDKIYFECRNKEIVSTILFLNEHSTNFVNFNIFMIATLCKYQGYSVLHLASEKNFLGIVTKILDKQLVPINHKTDGGLTALKCARRYQNKEIIKVLIDSGAIVSAIEKKKIVRKDQSMFPECLQTASLEKLLMENKINLNSKVSASSPVFKAVIDCDLKSLKLLIKFKADLNITYENKRNIVEVAAEYSSKEILILLLQETQGQYDKKIINLLRLSIMGRNMDNIKILLSRTVNLNEIVAEPPKGTIMHYAAYVGDIAIIELLYQNNVDLESCYLGLTPLFVAIEGQNIDAINYLLSIGANLNHKAEDNMTILHYAAKSGNHLIVKMLIDKGLDIETFDKINQTPLFYSIKNCNLDTFNYLLSKGANFDHTVFTLTTLHLAAKFGNKEMVNTLIGKNCNLEVTDENEATPIFYAIKGKNTETFKFLVSKGANLDCTTKDSSSILHYAAQYGNPEMVEVLMDKGCNVEAVDGFNRTPVFLAIEKKNVATLNYLIRRKVNLNHQSENYSVQECAEIFGNKTIKKIVRNQFNNLQTNNE